MNDMQAGQRRGPLSRERRETIQQLDHHPAGSHEDTSTMT